MNRPPPPKKPRLSMACNICRQRKVKCDAKYPKCRNCRMRDQDCITTDPQRPGYPGVREWIEVPEKPATTPPSNVEHIPQVRRNDYTEEFRTDPVHDQSERLNVNAGRADNADAENEISPVHHPFDTSVNVEDGTNRMKVLGTSSSQCLAKSLDVYFKTARMKPVSGFFLHGMRHAEEFDLVLGVSLPSLPEPQIQRQYVSEYRLRIHPLYPIFNLNALDAGIQQLASVTSFRDLSRENIVLLVAVYLVLSLGADESARQPTDDGKQYLDAASTLLAHVIVTPYLSAVQALLAFTMAYRGRNHEGLAWQTLGMAIRIACTLGIHRGPTPRTAGDQSTHSRVWAVCCCLESMMQLDCGRPTAITPTMMTSMDTLDSEQKFLRWHLGLAEYQRNISQHLYDYKKGTRRVEQILLDTARLDRALLAWANQIPPELRPGNDIFCSRAEFHIVAFLSIQYHGAMIALHRAALIARTSSIEAEVAKYCSRDPSQFRLRNGELICVNSARAIAKLSIELSERETDSCLITVGSSLLACIVLAIYLMKHPASGLQAMDRQLLRACLTNSDAQLSQCNSDPRFIDGLTVMYEQIQNYLDSYTASHPVQKPNSSRRLESNRSIRSTNTLKRNSDHLLHHASSPASHGPLTPMTGSYSVDGAESIQPPNGNFHATLQRQASDRRHSDTPMLDTTQQQQQRDQGNQFAFEDYNTNAFNALSGVDTAANTIDGFPFEGFNIEDLWNWMLYYDDSFSIEGV